MPFGIRTNATEYAYADKRDEEKGDKCKKPKFSCVTHETVTFGFCSFCLVLSVGGVFIL